MSSAVTSLKKEICSILSLLNTQNERQEWIKVGMVVNFHIVKG